MGIVGLEHPVALVTGGASGIGLAVVRRLAGQGTRVLVADIDEAGALAVPPGTRFVRADVRDPRALEAAVAEAESAFGGLDLAVLNAGTVTGTADLAALDLERYRDVVGVNVDGVVFGVRAALPALRRPHPHGAIVVTASLAGLGPWAGDPVYAMTKHAVVGLTRSLAEPLAAEGIRINCVCPGFADTPMLASVPAPAGSQVLDPDEVALAVLAAAASPRSGEAWVCQPGRDPEPYRFRGVPGPRPARARERPRLPDPPNPSW